MEKRYNARNKIVEQHVAANPRIGHWLNKLKRNYGDSFTGWSKTGPSIIISSIVPRNSIICINPQLTGVTNPFTTVPGLTTQNLAVTLTKNNIGKLTSIFLLDEITQERIPVTHTVTGNSITFQVLATIGDANTILKPRAYKLMIVDDHNAPFNCGAINLQWPWGITYGPRDVWLPLSTSVDSELLFTSNTTNTNYAYYKSAKTFLPNQNVIFALDIARTPTTVTAEMFSVGITSDILNNNVSSVSEQTMAGSYVKLHNGTFYRDTTTSLGTYTGWPAYPTQIIMCILNNIVYIGYNRTNMYFLRDLNVNPFVFQSGDQNLRLLIVVRNNLTAITSFIVKMKEIPV